MTALLQQPGFQMRAATLSVHAWHRMIEQGLAPQRSELLRGIIFTKMSKAIQHIKLKSRIEQHVRQVLGPAYWVRLEDPITTHDSEPEPDLSVVDGTEADYQQHPTTGRLVVEISVTTLAEDRAMAEIYAEAGVEEFWIVNASDCAIEIHRAPRDGCYGEVVVCRAGEIAECRALPQVRVDVRALFAGLTGEPG